MSPTILGWSNKKPCIASCHANTALLGRVTLVIVINLSRGRCVGQSVCPVHCGKTADPIRMPFGIIRTGPGMRQVVGFGYRSIGRGTFGGEFGARHCSQSCKGKGRFWGFLFPIFTMGNALGSPTVKCFRFVCENLTTFPFRKRIVGKLDSWAFWRYIQFQDQSWGLWEISKKVTIDLRKLTAQHFQRRLFLELHCA